MPGQPLVSALSTYLDVRRALLVLDNCEHLLAACAELVEALLGACDEFTVMATSRAPLAVAGETAWRVPPLSLPAGDAGLALDRSDAIWLFVERGRKARPGFPVTADAVLAHFCRELDGLPLGDAFQLVASGMRGGKGVPESVAGHPMVFLTLTAPSFGPVHSRRVVDGKARRCRPRRKGEVCPHGVSLVCREAHDEDDPRLGEPLCPKCFDYEHAVLWNALAPELWRYTSIQLQRELARLTGVSQSRLRVRVSYVKVAEFQRRGALHFHCVLRLDGRSGSGELEAPTCEFGTRLLIDAATSAARHVSVRSPDPVDRNGRLPGFAAGQAREIRWGRQIEVRELNSLGSAAEAASCAGYIAKYATKSTEAVGGLMYRLDAADLSRLRVRPHVRRYVETAWRLGGQRHLHELRLRRWAHQLGFRGHCFTKSRRYSTTFTALRRARHEHQLRRHGEARAVGDRIGRWQYSGSGYRTLGDAWLAESGRKRAVAERRIARDELRAGQPVGGEMRREGRR